MLILKQPSVRIGIITLALCAVIGCATSMSHKLNRLQLGMGPGQVKKILGDDYIIKASKTDTNGSTLQMWQYTDTKTEEHFSLYFKDNQLAQWGTQGRLDFPDLTVPNK
jgi:hypothetical protein